MRLIACDSCHTQYDVTDVVAESIPCRCGKSLANREQEAVDTKVHRCASCGASASGEDEICDYCGTEIVREPGALSLICPECYGRCAEDARYCTACGVEFRPEEVRLDGYELPCPVCDLLMPPHQVSGLGLNECTTCHGLWVPGDAFEALVARARQAREATGSDAPQPARVTGGNPARQQVAYRKCPECQAFMQRRNYRKSSGIIIDVCNTHGTWLDPDELEQIAGFLSTGGETSPTLQAEDAAAERAFRQLRAEAAMQRTSRSSGWVESETRSGVETLLDIVGAILRHT